MLCDTALAPPTVTEQAWTQQVCEPEEFTCGSLSLVLQILLPFNLFSF